VNQPLPSPLRFLPLLALTACFVSRESHGPPVAEPAEEATRAPRAVDTGSPALLPDPADAPPAARPRPTAKPAREPNFRQLPDDHVRSEPPRPEPEPEIALDYGGSTYLSNDDSMSLASAQRMIWALQHGRSLRPADIRKHELLNYFTFPTTSPRGDETFGVAASAERDGDELHLALAVEGIAPPRPPLDLTVVVDRSGSMGQDDRMGFTQRGLEILGEQLREGDTVDLIAFDSNVELLLEDLEIDYERGDPWGSAVRSLHPGGATNLSGALDLAYDVARRQGADSHRIRRVLLLTDARTNRGELDEHLLSEVGRHLDEADVRLSAIGVGHDVDDGMLDRLTEKGKGAYVFLGSDAVVDRVFGPSFDALVQTIAHDVRFKLHLPPSLALKRFHGEESSKEARDVQPVHFFSGNQQLFLSDLAVDDDAYDPREELSLDITWRDPVTDAPRSQRFTTTVGQAIDSSPFAVRKARALVGWSEVAMAQAMGADCGSPMSHFEALASRVDDPEIDFIAGLLDGQCRTRPSPPFVLLRVDPNTPHQQVELACENGWRQRAHIVGGIASFKDAPTHTACNVSFRVGAETRRTRLASSGDFTCSIGAQTSCEPT